MRYMMFVATDPEAEPFVPEDDDIGEWVAEIESPRRARVRRAAAAG